MEWSRVEQSAVERIRVGWNHGEWIGVNLKGYERSGLGRIRADWSGLEWS